MTDKYTAQDVRVFIERYNSGDVAWQEADDYLNAYATRLEADENAKAVTWRSTTLPTTFICDSPKNLDYDKWEPLYTHPAPASVERLAEALQSIKWDLENCDWCCGRCGQDYGMRETDAYDTCVKALAAHATAQPAGEGVQAVKCEHTWTGGGLNVGVQCLKCGRGINADVLDALDGQPPAQPRAAQPPAQILVPDGWVIKELDDGFVHIESPRGAAVNLGYMSEGSAAASRLLRSLASDILSAQAAQPPAASVPDGYVLVPRMPTIPMLIAANAAWPIPDPSPFAKADVARAVIWMAMVGAAAQQPDAGDAREGVK